MKRLLALWLVALCLLSFPAFGEEGVNAASVSRIQLSTEMITIGVGQAVSLTPVITPASASGAALTWHSSNTAVAAASGGTITGAKLGYSIVQVRAANGISAYVGVKVVPQGGGVTVIRVSPAALTVYEGFTGKLTVALAPKTALDRTGKWISSAPAVAIVSSAGVVKGLSLGVADISAVASSGISAQSSVAVVEVPVTKIALAKKALTLRADQSVKMTVAVAPASAKKRTLQWESADDGVFTVTQEGVVTATGAGKAYLTVRSAFYPSVAARCMITVSSVKVASVRLSPVALTVKTGATLPVAYQVLPTNATNRSLKWVSSAPGIVSVDQDGVITARAPGQAVVTAVAADGSKKKNTCRITVAAE